MADQPEGDEKGLRRRTVGRRLWAVAALVGLVLVAWGLIQATLRAQTERDLAVGWETHTLQVQLETQRLVSALQDAETGERGYLIQGAGRVLQPYLAGGVEVPRRLAALTRLTSDNRAQQDRLAALKPLIDLRMALLAQGVAAPGLDAATGAREARGVVLMDDIRARLRAVANEESVLLARRRAAAVEATRRARIWTWSLAGLGGVLLFAALGAASAAARAMTSNRLAAQRAAVAEQVRAQLEAAVKAATRELRETEAQLRQSQKMEAIGHLTGGIAHDFNNMLSIIIGSLDIIERRLARGQTDVQHYLDGAAEGARRAAELTQRLLAFARRQPLAPATIDANTLVAGMSELLRHTLGESVQLETVLAGGLWRAFADPHQLESAILNLAVNARDALPDGGKLTIETANAYLDDAYVAHEVDVEAGQYVVVAITDNGVGMPRDVVDKAVEPFFTTKEVGRGTGLGLSQVYGFVKQSGGHLKLYSEVGRGTTIKIYLPRRFEEAESVQTRPAAPAACLPDGQPGEIVLVVEDEPRVRRMSVEALRDLGYTVRHAADGDAALRLLDAQPGVRLLFTDIVMPGLNGRQLADAAQARLPGLKVLYTTGYTRNAVVHNGALDPGVAFLPKPFTIAQLAGKVREVMDA